MSAFPISQIRNEFPALSLTDNGVPRIYLDNPAGTQVPNRVIHRVTDCLVRTNANLGGYFSSSVLADEGVAAAHRAMADFLNAPSPDEIVFGQNMTSLTFQISRSLGKELNPGDEIVVTRMDHDANVAPWMMLAEDTGCTLRWLDFSPESYAYNLNDLDEILTPRTRIVAVNHASNLLGTINDVKRITETAHQRGALVYVDSVQFAPHGLIDVQDIGCDFLVCSAYKFFGPHQGILWGKGEILERMVPYKVRPAGNDVPHRFERGTLSHEDMAGTLGAIEYFAEVGKKFGHAQAAASGSNERRSQIEAAMQLFVNYEMLLTERLISGLLALPGVTVTGITDKQNYSSRVPTVTFKHKTIHPDHIAEKLAEKNIFVWSGHNYAVEIVKRLGLEKKGGVVRIGIAHYNTPEEIDRTLEAVEHVLQSTG